MKAICLPLRDRSSFWAFWSSNMPGSVRFSRSAWHLRRLGERAPQLPRVRRGRRRTGRRLVLVCVCVCSLPCSSLTAAAPQGPLRDEMSSRCCSHARCVQRQVPWVTKCGKLRIFRSCSLSTRSSTFLSCCRG